jgi:uncharacterized protein
MLAAVQDNESAMRERRCIATGAILPEEKLVRFVVGPEGEVVPDIDAKLPGRGLWLSADRAVIARAVAKNDFAKAAKASVKAAPDLAARVERLVVARLQSDLGLARRAGLLALGFDNVVRALDAKVPPRLVVEASDAAADGRRKLASAMASRGLKVETIDGLGREELSSALGADNAVHAAVKPGVLADRMILNAVRLRGFRTPAPSNEREA